MHRRRWQSGTLADLGLLTGIVMMSNSPSHGDERLNRSWAGQPLAQAQWSTFTSESGGFAVAMPNQPVLTTDTDEIEGESIEIYEFTSETDSSSYTIFYIDLPASYVSRGVETVLNGVRDRMMDGMENDALSNALKASEVAVQLDRYPGRRYVYRHEYFTLDMRLYLVGDRVYLVAGTDVEAAAVSQFMSSFELL